MIDSYLTITARVPPTLTHLRPPSAALRPAAVVLGLLLMCAALHARIIQVEAPILQDKGVTAIVPGSNQLGPYQKVIIKDQLMLLGGSLWYSLPLSTVNPHLYNLFPVVIDVPDNPAAIGEFDLPSVLVADIGDGIGPLPDGFLLSETMQVNGAFFDAVITPIAGLANLPTSTMRDSLIQWDISSVSHTTGTFYLATTTLPLPVPVPEPSCAATAFTGGLVIVLLYSGFRPRFRRASVRTF